MSNLDTTILISNFISFILGMIFMFIIILCYNSYSDSKKRESKYSYNKSYEYPNPNIDIQPESNNKINYSNNDLSSPLAILENNKKEFAALFIVCLCIGFYCGNLLLQVKMHY